MFDEIPKQNPPRRKLKHAFWIHDTITDASSVSGYFILPTARCSRCGYQVRSEKPRCPGCRAVMDGTRANDAEISDRKRQ